MLKRGIGILSLFLCCMAIIWAGGKIAINVVSNKVNVIIGYDDKNPYLYSDRLKTIQAKLNRVLSFNLTNYSAIEENGFWNKATETALNTFQEMYYKKYHLQRYYAFSADQNVNINAVEGILDNELPNPANFLKESQEGVKLKLGDPAKYYGNTCQDEIRRIEKGLNGDYVDPVTGELSKTILIYRTPVGNDHLLPIQLTARYGSQYTGNVGMGPGWFLSESYSLWFSFEKNEVIVQDGSGVSQKYQYIDGKFTRKGETTDGGYFKEISLEGVLGTEESKIKVKTATGDVLEFGGFLNKGESTVGDVINAIGSAGTIYGYSINSDLRNIKITNTVYFTGFIWGTLTNYNHNSGTSTVSTQISQGFFLGTSSSNTIVDKYTNINKGIFADMKSLSEKMENNGKLDNPQLYCDKNNFINDVKTYLRDNNEGGWSVSIYTYKDGKIQSLRRSGTGKPDVYGGYALQSITNRFGAYKIYTYNTYQKLTGISSYSPGESLIDKVSLCRDENENVNNSERNLIYRIMDGQTGGPTWQANITYAGEIWELSQIMLIIDGNILNYSFDYDLKQISDTNSSNMIALANNLISNKNEMEKAINDINGNMHNIMDHKKEWNGLTNEINGKKIILTEEYFDTMIAFLKQQFYDMNNNLFKIEQQLNDFNAGRMFSWIALLKSSREQSGITTRWAQYTFANLGTNTFNVTNTEIGVRLITVITPYNTGTFSYSGGSTGYKNLNGNTFTFTYNQTLTNYSERRVTGITYPDSSSVSLAYETRGNITYVKNEIGNIYNYQYDESGNVTNKTVPGERSWSYEYTNDTAKYLGRPTKIKQPDGTEYQMSYDTNGEMTNQSIWQTGGSINIATVSFAYSGSAYTKTIKDMYGSATAYGYDNNHNLKSITYPDNGIYTYTCDTYGNVTIENRSGMVTLFYKYNSRGNVTEQGISNYNISRIEYDVWGDKTKTTDPNGNPTSFSYDSGGRLQIITFPGSKTVTYGYDAEGNKTSEVFDKDKQIVYTYDAKGKLTEKYLSQTGQNYNYYYSYDTAGNLIGQKMTGRGFDSTKIGYPGNVVDSTYVYDGIGLLINETDNNSGKTVSYSYDQMGRLTNEVQTKDGESYIKKYTYDAINRNTSLRTSLGNSPIVMISSNNYDKTVHSMEKIDQYGNHSTSYYDFRNNATNLKYSVFDPALSSLKQYAHTYSYDALGNKTGEVYPDGTKQSWEYINGNRLYKENKRYRDGEGIVNKTYDYDLAGHITKITDFNGNAWTKSYNSMGFLSEESDPENRRISYEYDIFGNPAVIRNGSRTRRMTYNLLNRPIQEINEGGAVSTTDLVYYDALGNPTVFEPGSNQYFQSIRVYDSGGKLICQQDPNGLRTIINYDAMGNIKEKTMKDASGTKLRKWSYTYDSNGRLTSETLPDKTIIAYTYELQNNNIPVKTKAWNAVGRVERYYYDQMDRVIKTVIVDPAINNNKSGYSFYNDNGIVSGKIYNEAGLPVKEIIPGGMTRSYSYNGDGKITTETNEIGQVKTIEYDKNGLMTGMKDFDGNTYLYSYDNSGKIKIETNPDGGTTAYSYDETGNVSKKVLPGGEAYSYEYNYKNQIVKETAPFGGSTTYDYNALGQVVKISSPGNGDTAFNYNDNGVLLNVERNGNDGGSDFITSFDINIFGETNAVINPDGGKTAFVYDNLGRVVLKAVGDGKQIAAAALQSRNDRADTGQVVFQYTYTPDGYPESITYPNGSVEKSSYSQSGLLTNKYYITNGIRCRETAYQYVKADGSYNGRPVKVRDYRGITTVYEYDGLGRATNITERSSYGDGRSTFYQYDYANNNSGGMVFNTVTSWKSGMPFGSAQGADIPDREWTKEVRDFRGNTTEIWKKFNGGSPVKSTERAYNKSGKIIDDRRWNGTFSCSETTYSYNSSGLLNSKTDPAGLKTEYSYDSAGRVVEKREEGRTDTYDYHRNGTLKRSLEGNSSRIESYEYDFRGNVRKKRDELSKTENRTFYDIYGNKISESVSYGGKTTGRKWKYDNMGRTVSSLNEEGGETRYQYDPFGQKVGETRQSATTPSNSPFVKGESSTSLIVTYSYDSSGNMVEKSQNGQIMEEGQWIEKQYIYQYQYDGWGNNSAVTYPDGINSQTLYDPWGIKISERDRLGYNTAYSYDRYGRNTLRTMESPSGVLSISNEYDYSGKMVTEIATASPRNDQLGSGQVQPSPRTTRYEYDSSGNLVKQTLVCAGESGDISKSYGYDEYGNKLWETDYKGNREYTFYDDLNRPVRRIDREGNITETAYSYDGNGAYRVTSTQVDIVSQTGISATTINDGFGNKVQITDPNGNSEYYEYNNSGKPIKVTDRNGFSSFFRYDAWGKLAASIDPYGKSVSNVYDAFDNAVQTVDKENHSLYREYDWAGRMVRSKDAMGNMSYFQYGVSSEEIATASPRNDNLARPRNEGIAASALAKIPMTPASTSSAHRFEKGEYVFSGEKNQSLSSFSFVSSNKRKGSEKKNAAAYATTTSVLSRSETGALNSPLTGKTAFNESLFNSEKDKGIKSTDSGLNNQRTEPSLRGKTYGGLRYGGGETTGMTERGESNNNALTPYARGQIYASGSTTLRQHFDSTSTGSVYQLTASLRYGGGKAMGMGTTRTTPLVPASTRLRQAQPDSSGTEGDWTTREGAADCSDVSSAGGEVTHGDYKYQVFEMTAFLSSFTSSGDGENASPPAPLQDWRGEKKCEKEIFIDAEGNKTTTYRYGKQTLSIVDAMENKTSYAYECFRRHYNGG